MADKTPRSNPIKLTHVRLSYPHLDKPRAFEAGQPSRFESTFILDPSNPEHKTVFKSVMNEALRLAKEAFGPDATLKKLKGVCFGKGDDLDNPDEAYKGMLYVRTARKEEHGRPAVANRRGQPVMPTDSEWPYGGCYVLASIELWVQDNKYGKRVNANLRGVQFMEDGEAFGMAPISAESEFEALDDNTPADDMDDGDDGLDDFDI